MNRLKLKTFRSRVLCAFYIFSMLPTLIVAMISMGNTTHILEQNVKTLTEKNLEQINQNVEFQLNSYEDVLYQLYTDDRIVELVNHINANIDPELCKRELIYKFREVVRAKPYIESLMIISNSSERIFYDKLTTASTRSSWTESYPISMKEIYNQTIQSRKTVIFPTEYASNYLAQKNYLFHMGHRIIDYKNLNKEIGIVILSLNQKMLDKVCNKDYKNERLGIYFLVDENNQLMSIPDVNYVEEKQYNAKKKMLSDTLYHQIARKMQRFAGKDILLHYVTDGETGWTAVGVADKEVFFQEVKKQRNWIIIFAILSIVLLSIIGYFITKQLTSSIRIITDSMKRVSKGNLSERIKIRKNMPEEIGDIAKQFNDMVGKVERSIENERMATIKQKNAEIAFLEAQINPHFLYNTLDTINWMAIDVEQYEISDAVNLLAQILRYSISESNKMVTVAEDIEWLKKYIFLQQYRINSTLNCSIYVEPEVREYLIHKQLIQVFVENSIKHGFTQEQSEFLLEIILEQESKYLKITVHDNGCGMEQEKLNAIFNKEKMKSHIGIQNAIERIRIYYGDMAQVKIESKKNIGTCVVIYLPKEIGSGESDEGSNSRR